MGHVAKIYRAISEAEFFPRELYKESQRETEWMAKVRDRGKRRRDWRQSKERRRKAYMKIVTSTNKKLRIKGQIWCS